MKNEENVTEERCCFLCHPTSNILLCVFPQVQQNGVEGGEVIVEGIGHRLECPEGIRLSWKLKAAGHGEEL